MKRVWYLLALFAAGIVAQPVAGGEDGFRALFDGKTLTGWEGNTEIFRVENGAIHGGSLTEPISHNEFLCTTDTFTDFELRLEAKLVGNGKNAGVQFRSRRIPNHHEVIGYQCDIGRMDTRSIWGSLYDESRRRRFLAEGDADKLIAAVNQGGWNRIVIRCQGPRIRIWVNEVQTVDYTETESEIARSGIIGLQIHGGPPAVASYRNIRVKGLDE